MPGGNICRFCGRETGFNPYLGDTNPEHVREIHNTSAPSVDILHAEDREYDTFCSKEHYLKWIREERHRLPTTRPEEGTDETHDSL